MPVHVYTGSIKWLAAKWLLTVWPKTCSFFPVFQPKYDKHLLAVVVSARSDWHWQLVSVGLANLKVARKVSSTYECKNNRKKILEWFHNALLQMFKISFLPCHFKSSNRSPATGTREANCKFSSHLHFRYLSFGSGGQGMIRLTPTIGVSSLDKFDSGS